MLIPTLVTVFAVLIIGGSCATTSYEKPDAGSCITASEIREEKEDKKPPMTLITVDSGDYAEIKGAQKQVQNEKDAKQQNANQKSREYITNLIIPCHAANVHSQEEHPEKGNDLRVDIDLHNDLILRFKYMGGRGIRQQDGVDSNKCGPAGDRNKERR